MPFVQVHLKRATLKICVAGLEQSHYLHSPFTVSLIDLSFVIASMDHWKWLGFDRCAYSSYNRVAKIRLKWWLLMHCFSDISIWSSHIMKFIITYTARFSHLILSLYTKLSIELRLQITTCNWYADFWIKVNRIWTEFNENTASNRVFTVPVGFWIIDFQQDEIIFILWIPFNFWIGELKLKSTNLFATDLNDSLL